MALIYTNLLLNSGVINEFLTHRVKARFSLNLSPSFYKSVSPALNLYELIFCVGGENIRNLPRQQQRKSLPS
jgi:hypothetical protein